MRVRSVVEQQGGRLLRPAGTRRRRARSARDRSRARCRRRARAACARCRDGRGRRRGSGASRRWRRSGWPARPSRSPRTTRLVRPSRARSRMPRRKLSSSSESSPAMDAILRLQRDAPPADGVAGIQWRARHRHQSLRRDRERRAEEPPVHARDELARAEPAVLGGLGDTDRARRPGSRSAHAIRPRPNGSGKRLEFS